MSGTRNTPEIPQFSDEDIAAYRDAEARRIDKLHRSLWWRWFSFRMHLRLFLTTGNPRWLLMRPIYKQLEVPVLSFHRDPSHAGALHPTDPPDVCHSIAHGDEEMAECPKD